LDFLGRDCVVGNFVRRYRAISDALRRYRRIHNVLRIDDTVAIHIESDFHPLRRVFIDGIVSWCDRRNQNVAVREIC
jgi:hypothetical protein